MSRTSSARQAEVIRNTRISLWQWVLTLSPPAYLLGATCIVFFGLHLAALNAFASDYDEGVYWQSLRAMAAGHPLFSSVFSSQPPFFLLGVYPFYALFGQGIAAARLGILVSACVGLIATYFIGQRLVGRWAGLLSALLLATNPLYFHQSGVLQAEVPSVAWSLVGLALVSAALGARGERRRWLAALGGIALGLSIMTKLYEVVALVPAIGYFVLPPARRIVLDQVRRIRGAGTAAARPQIEVDAGLVAFAAGLALGIALMVVPYLGSLGAFYEQVVRFHLLAAQENQQTLPDNLGVIADTFVRNAAYLLVVLALVAFAPALRQTFSRLLPLVLWLVAAFIVLVRQHPLFEHHLLLLVPPLTLLAGAALPLATRGLPYARLQAAATSRRALVLYATLALVVFVAISSFQISLAGLRQPTGVPVSQARMALALRAVSVAGDPVVSDDQYLAALAGRSVPPELVDTSMVRINSGELTTAHIERVIMASDVRVILFASDRFDLLPSFREWVAAHYELAATFGNGHALYIKAPAGPPTA